MIAAFESPAAMPERGSNVSAAPIATLAKARKGRFMMYASPRIIEYKLRATSAKRRRSFL